MLTWLQVGLSLWLFLESMWNLVSRNAVCLFHQLQVITCTCTTSKIIHGELNHMFAMRKYEQEKETKSEVKGGVVHQAIKVHVRK